MPRAFEYFQVDVFTERTLEGNALAVIPDALGVTDVEMQRVAREFNLSETVFVLPPDDPAHAARYRIFTPFRELPFAGHPTVGTSWVLRRGGRVSGDRFVVEENVGPVPIRVETRPAGDRIWLTVPPVTIGETVDREAVAASLGLPLRDLREDVPPQFASAGPPFLFVTVRDREAVDRAAFEPRILRERTARGGAEVFDFAPLPDTDGEPGDTYAVYSRMFAPELGIAEDPATGGATGPLAAFMIARGLLPAENGLRLVSEQGTKMGRRSLLHVLLHVEGERVVIELGGDVAPFARGTLTLPD